MTSPGPILEPSVSVVVPFYNEESHLGACLRSLLKQDFRPMEIIGVDDGSQDSSAEVCAGLGVRVIKGSHNGMAAARNAGAMATSGNILVMLDADMTFDPEYVSRLVAPIISGNAVATSHWNERVANWDNPWARCQTWYFGLPDGRRHPAGKPPGSGQYRAVRKDFFLDNGGLSEAEGYTADISLFRKTGVYADIIDDAVCYHRNVEGPAELFKEAVWRGRSLAFKKEGRVARILAAAFLHRNPLIDALRTVRQAFSRREPRLPLYALLFSSGQLFGAVSALVSGNYQK